jgi:hypothetical protein
MMVLANGNISAMILPCMGVGYASLLMAWHNNRYAEIEDGTVKNNLQPWLHEGGRLELPICTIC